MSSTYNEIINQFTLDLSPPDPNRVYKISDFSKTKGVTLLMKCILLYEIQPDILNSISDDLIKSELESETDGNLLRTRSIHIATIHSKLLTEYALFKLLDAKANLNIQDTYGYTALMIAVGNEGSSEKTIEMLLEAKANLDLQDSYGKTALMIATVRNEKTVEMLIKAKANLDLQDKDGRTALRLSCGMMIKTNSSNMLIEAKANLNIQDNSGNTALMISGGNKKIVEMLINAKASLDLQDNDGRTALFLHARRQSNLSTVCARRQTNISTVKMLIEAKANVDIPAKNGLTTLMISCWETEDVDYSTTKTVEILIQAKANLDLQTGDGNTALMLATWSDKDSAQKIIEILIDAKANLNLQNDKNQYILDILYDTNYNNCLLQKLLLLNAKHNKIELFKIRCELYKNQLRKRHGFINSK